MAKTALADNSILTASADQSGDIINILPYLLEKCNMTVDGVREEMNKKEREKILMDHKYSIFLANDGRWKTSVSDLTKKNGRRVIAKKRKADLLDAIVDYYQDRQYKDTSDKITIKMLYPEWLEYKSLHTTSSSYMRRIQNDWDKYYKNDGIIDVPIKALSFLKLDEWAHRLIKEHGLTKKQYYNLSLIIRQCLEYAVEKNILVSSPFERVKIDSKMFKPTPKPQSSTQVFSEAEEEAICKLALEKYRKRPKSINGLAVIFNFNLGLRAGELVALKWSDISDDNYIHIQREEIKSYEVHSSEDIRKCGTEVAEHTKSMAGDRIIYLNQNARDVLDIIKARNDKYNLHDGDYIFVNSASKRLGSSKLNRYIYSLCDELGIPRRSSHKIRKTVISTLIDSGMNINSVRELAGHEDERTTYHNYCFDRRGSETNERILDNLPKISIAI